jgi:hypothetical protein
MKRYFVEPEVAGELGEDTVLDSTRHPPVVSRLHYRLDALPTDCLIESFPCFVVTDEAMAAIRDARLSGAAFGPMRLTASPELLAENPSAELPAMHWLRVDGGMDADFSIGPDHRLVLSQRALDLLSGISLTGAVVEAIE